MKKKNFAKKKILRNNYEKKLEPTSHQRLESLTTSSDTIFQQIEKFRNFFRNFCHLPRFLILTICKCTKRSIITFALATVLLVIL